MKIKWKYLGGGYVPGIPARDLTQDEAEVIGNELIKKSGLYQLMPDEESKEKPAEKRKGQ